MKMELDDPSAFCSWQSPRRNSLSGESGGPSQDGAYTPERPVPSPIAEYDRRWSFDPGRRFIRCVYHIRRDALFSALFKKLVE
jgi:hypothetical protein